MPQIIISYHGNLRITTAISDRNLNILCAACENSVSSWESLVFGLIFICSYIMMVSQQRDVACTPTLNEMKREVRKMEKVILISIDGMRPDGFLKCGNPFTEKMMSLGSYTLEGRTVYPSVTLPCHMSMFHSVPPERHGITTNFYMPMVRPLNGLFEQIRLCGGVSAMYYGWEPLRDVARPESLKFSSYVHSYSEDATDGLLTDLALERIEKSRPDFVFLYMVETDEKGGHDNGWMSQPYLACINAAVENVKRVYEAAGDEYTIVVTADHGGHDRGHGSDAPEDMTIPMFFIGKRFEPGKVLTDVSILDLAPTIADVMSVLRAPEWEGKSVAGK